MPKEEDQPKRRKRECCCPNSRARVRRRIERARGISRALATQDSPPSSLHPIEMEMSLHPAPRNDHQRGRKGTGETQVGLLPRKESSIRAGCGRKSPFVRNRGKHKLARSQGRMAAKPERRLPEAERPQGRGGGVPTEPRGEERPAPPQQPVSPPRPARRGSAPRPWPAAGAV